jgi:transposase-like protein
MTENQITRHPKRRFSREERRNYYIAWKKSELNQTDFCKAHGISRSALFQWSKEFKKEDNDFGFSPLMIEKKSPVKSTDMIQLNIAFTNHHMQLSLVMPEHRLVSFIQEIGYAVAIVR